MKLKLIVFIIALSTTLFSYTNTISIKLAQPENIPALITLNEELLDEYFGPTLVTGFPEYFSYDTPLLQEFREGWNCMFQTILEDGIEQLDDHHILIATNNEYPKVILGLCAFTKKEDSIHLEYLIVSQKLRNKGIGKMLLDTALAMYDDVTTCWLETIAAESNKKTHAFYERYGFTSTKEPHSLIECAPNTHIIYQLTIAK
jgi:ribosomal protein S18 acetylase RimI-like enzyme